MPFKPDFKPPPLESAQALCFVFHEDRLLIKTNDDSCLIPCSKDLAEFEILPIHRQYIGSLNGVACYAAELPDNRLGPDGVTLKGLRELFGSVDEDLIWTAGRANQLVHWNRIHQYCGQCGHLTEDKSDERAKICPECGLVNYPRLSPAIIVAVVRDNQLLLARNKRFKTGFYSVLAGFVEPSESLEECVAREVREEVGIAVKNIRYFGSQPWPFPDSLMVGFLADYAGGEISVDKSEIVDAGWFSAQNLPPVPPKISIARQLIDWFAKNQ